MHESIRRRLLATPRDIQKIGLAFSASLPSGRDQILRIRVHLKALMARAGIFQFVGAFQGPSLRHDDLLLSRPDAVSVGRVTNVNLINPWCMPFLDQSFAFNMDLLLDRADLDVLL